jgi:hypothetical protein
MREASLAKFYFTKYFFLALGLLQVLIGALLFVRQGTSLKGQFASMLFFTLGLIFISLYMTVASKIKRVAVSKKKLVVIGRYKNQRYDWDDVKSLRLMPVFNLYSLKVKGKKEKIFFLPTRSTSAIYGLFPSDPDLAFRKVK